MLNLHVTEQDGNMWMVSETPGSASLDFINAHFGPTPRVEKIIITAKQEGDMVLQQNVMDQLYAIQEEIYNFNVSMEGVAVSLK